MSSDAVVLERVGLAKRFRSRWALRDCTLSIPTGRVAALVGPNGAGKSTLLRIAAGLTRPSEGTVRVLGDVPATCDVMQRVGYLDQDLPLLDGFRVREMLRFAELTNPTWDMETATRYITQLDIPLDVRVESLSGGQRAQVALTLCLAKQPELLLLDEPAAALDPVAREDLLRLLMQQVADHGTSVVLSTHALGDVVAICDYVVILCNARVVLSDDIDFILESHRFFTGLSHDGTALPAGVTVIDEQRTTRGTTFLVRVELPVDEERWQLQRPTLDEVVLAYLRSGVAGARHAQSSGERDSNGERR